MCSVKCFHCAYILDVTILCLLKKKNCKMYILDFSPISEEKKKNPTQTFKKIFY